MTPQDRQHFEDILVKAVQSGKKETSDLVDDILHKIEPIIKDSIQTNVNGKIDKINQKMDDYIISDLKWKDSVKPSIEIMRTLTDTTVGVSWLLKSVIILGSAVGVIYGLITWLKK
jgi:hypothetical protein